jgi:hypothetical protein
MPEPEKPLGSSVSFCFKIKPDDQSSGDPWGMILGSTLFRFNFELDKKY